MLLIGRSLLVAGLALALSGCGSDDGKGSDAGAGKDAPAADVAPEVISTDSATDSGTDAPIVDDIDAVADGGATPIFHTTISAEGYGEYCHTTTDCKKYGLKCFKFNSEDVFPFCSSSCETNWDCPDFYPCDYKYSPAQDEPVKVCMQARYCTDCQVDAQCMLAGMECIPDKHGGSFCSHRCEPGVLSCLGDSHCAFNEEMDDWYCMPFWGACLGDGTQCAPCKVEGDCPGKNMYCMEAFAFTKEKFCVSDCTPDGDDCTEGTHCFEIQDLGNRCLPVAGDTYYPSCFKGTQEFCHECKSDFQCSGDLLCYAGPQNVGYYCSPECDSDAACPSGMECKSQFGTYSVLPTGKYACALKAGATCSSLIKAGINE